MIQLSKENQRATLDKGELVGYRVGGHEFIHQKGSPGWRSSDTEMFPIIGPTAGADFEVKTPRGKALQDQHGLLRELEYELVGHSELHAVFQKKYKANTRVNNSKFPQASSVETLFWPYTFTFEKHVQLDENGLTITFEIAGELGMPFMLGYHPAFKLQSENTVVLAKGNSITIPEILAVGSRAMEIADCESIRLKDTKHLTITTKGFGNFMLWTEVPNMLCIEPITFYPYAVEQDGLDKGFMHLEHQNMLFMIHLNPNNDKNPY